MSKPQTIEESRPHWWRAIRSCDTREELDALRKGWADQGLTLSTEVMLEIEAREKRGWRSIGSITRDIIQGWGNS